MVKFLVHIGLVRLWLVLLQGCYMWLVNGCHWRLTMFCLTRAWYLVVGCIYVDDSLVRCVILLYEEDDGSKLVSGEAGDTANEVTSEAGKDVRDKEPLK